MPQLNAFTILPEKGQVDLQVPGVVITGQVDSTVVTPFVPGQCVKQTTTSSTGLPKFVAITATTDRVAGVVTYGTIFSAFAAGKPFELAMDNAVIYMEANAAIAPGAAVEAVIATNRVATKSTGTTIGYVYGGLGAAAAGDLVRVRLISPIA